jgi:hypothetical protein
LGKPLKQNPFLRCGFNDERSQYFGLLEKCRQILEEAQMAGFLLTFKKRYLGDNYGRRNLQMLAKKGSFAVTEAKKYIAQLLENWPEPIANLTRRIEFRAGGAYVFLKADPRVGRLKDLFLFISGNFTTN